MNEVISVKSKTNSSITVEWNTLNTVPNGLIQYYEYRLRYREQGMADQTREFVAHSTDTLSDTVTDLKPGVVYEFIVDTYRVISNERDQGGSYSLIQAKTDCTGVI